jgi:hypothetical protein
MTFLFASQEVAENTVIAKVNGELWDLDRPLEGDSTLELLMFNNEEAQAVSIGNQPTNQPTKFGVFIS